jgi:Zn-dependent peptidase ImmA (M78 family)
MVLEKKTAAQLLDELGITKPEDIDLEGIAAYCGAFVVYESLPGADARIVGNREKAIITINSNARPARKRFSIGHELGHWMWDRGKLALSCSAAVQDRNWYGADKESIANRFAAELLMPASMFRKQAHGREPTIKTASALADTFQSSLTSTAIRLVECGSHPAIVLLNSKHGREWFAASREIEGNLWPVKVLDEYSFAYDLLHAGNTQAASGLVEGDTWINHPRASNFEIYESSTLVAEDRVLTLLWWKDEAMIRTLVGDRF